MVPASHGYTAVGGNGKLRGGPVPLQRIKDTPLTMAIPHRPHVCSHANWHNHSTQGYRQNLCDLAGFIVELTSKLIYAPAEDRHSQTGCTLNLLLRNCTHKKEHTHNHKQCVCP